MGKQMSKGRSGFVFIGSLVLLGLDILSKIYTHNYIAPMRWTSLYPYGGVPVFQNWFGIDFSLNYVMNKGAAWGILSNFQIFLVCVRFLIMGALFFYLILGRLSFFKRCALSLILVGAVGNIIDFFVYGHVVDLFLFCFWGYIFPVFNLADAAIFCGVVLLLGQSFGEKQRSLKVL